MSGSPAGTAREATDRAALSIADASWAALRGIPGQLEDLSSEAGWSSLLLGYVRSQPEAATYESIPTPDLTVAVALSGRHRLEARSGGCWTAADYLPGAAGLTAPGVIDRLRWSGDTPFETAHLYISRPLLEDTAEALRRAGRRSSLPSLTMLVCDDPTILAVARSLLRRARDGAPDLLATHAAQFLASHLLINHAGADPQLRDDSGASTSDRRIARSIALIRARHADPLTLEALAAEAGISMFHFSRLFRAATGRAPHAYLTDVRMEAARRLLRGTDLPIATIAVRCGYPKQNPFGIAFKRVHGVSPLDYRRCGPERDSGRSS